MDTPVSYDLELPIRMNASKNAPWHDIPPFAMIAPHLGRASDLIYGALVPPNSAEELAPLLDHFMARSGKMIRPGLVLLGGACLGPITDEHIRVAAMVEMIHDATLLHDDVMDDGQARRGAPTINRVWGNESAVLLGDFVLSRVFRMTADLEPAIAKVVAETAVRVCEGELRQVAQKQNWQLTEDEYISIIADKSAAFFSGCCRLGGLLAHAETPHIEALDRYGLYAGIAFQIVDDLLDISGNEIQTGKTAQSDLNMSKLTLAVIHLLGAVGASEREKVHALLNHPAESGRELDTMLHHHGSLDYAHEHARRYVHKATEALASLPAGDARDALAETAHFMANRAA
jgi:octaprenyl-diphosphate synthase